MVFTFIFRYMISKTWFCGNYCNWNWKMFCDVIFKSHIVKIGNKMIHKKWTGSNRCLVLRAAELSKTLSLMCQNKITRQYLLEFKISPKGRMKDLAFRTVVCAHFLVTTPQINWLQSGALLSGLRFSQRPSCTEMNEQSWTDNQLGAKCLPASASTTWRHCFHRWRSQTWEGPQLNSQQQRFTVSSPMNFLKQQQQWNKQKGTFPRPESRLSG